MLSELLYESRNTRILLQENAQYGRHLVKTLNDEFPSPQAVRQFYNEYEIVRDLNVPGVRKAFEATKIHAHHVLLLEYIDAPTLHDFRKSGPSLEARIQVSAHIADVLDQLHRANVIHKDLTPGNILVDPATFDVHLIDFGISSKFSLRNMHLGNPEKLQGTLNYMSPEQTGRMNRVVDYRTDLYSLGMIFYELFTGRLPFGASDAMALVHAHIAGSVIPPHEVDPSVPSVISDMIVKLLSKNAEDRYQSAHGVKADLAKCVLQLQRTGSVNSFTIGQDDFSGKFQVTQKLYGREKEIDKLLKAFDRTRDGHRELLLVAGYSGTGKSSLVHETHKPITERRGYFIEGKFDQFQRAVPYFALLKAFRSLIHLILTEDEASLNAVRGRIQTAVGEEGKVLTDVLPDLELIIGKQPDVAEISPADSRNRFNYVFRRFVQSVCSPAHPVTMFVDDLQWADSSSLDLLSVLLTDYDLGNFLCICAYRDNEVNTAHPFIITVEGLREQGVSIESLTVGNLSREDVNALIADSLHMEHPETRTLTELVYQKTGGNAFFVTQFMHSLYENALLKYDFHLREWRWDINEIKAHDLPDDVVALMADKVQRMPQETQDILKLAACIGASFDAEMLTVISELDEEACFKVLESAIGEGLVLHSEKSYQFAHDRIQQAVYSLIPDASRVALHARIGKLLLERATAETQEERLFDIVNQLNEGIPVITDANERERLAGLNLSAARRAKETSAFEVAFSYARFGIELLKEEHWDSQPGLSFDLYNEAAETAFLCSRFDEMNTYIDTLLGHATRVEEKIRPYEIRIQSLKAENKLPAALATGLELLEMLGEKLPKKPNALKVMPDLLKTVRLLYGKSNEDIRDLPVNQDELKRAAIRVCAGIAPSSYWAKPDMFPFIIFRMIRLSIRYGNTAVSAFGYATYGVIMVGVFNLIRIADKYGKLGLMVLDKFNAKEWVAQIYTPVYALIQIWNQHVRNTLKPLQDSYHIGLETGAIEFACINANIYCIHAYLIGKPLEKLEHEIRDYSESFKRFKQGTNWEYNEVYRQAALNFMGRSANPLSLTGEAYDEVPMLRANLERENRISVFFIYFHKLILGNYFREDAEVLSFARSARPLLDAVLAKLEVSSFHFHETLAALGALERGDSSGRKWKGRVKKNLRKMKTWAKYAPENYLHKYELLRALYDSLHGRYAEAQDGFESAINHAREHAYLNEEGLACELASEFYHKRGNPNLRSHYLKNAFQAYREWGAQGKLQDLQHRYPEIIGSMMHQPRESARTTRFDQSITTTTTAAGNLLDLNTVLKASESISGEIVLHKLLAKLMDILMENLGATKGVLMLVHDGELSIEVQSSMDNLSYVQMPALHSGEVPDTLVSFVRRTQQPEVVSLAQGKESYKLDPYVQKHHPQSMLGYPIMHKGVLMGILYFENHLAESAFTEERIEMLSLLSGQIAISIENAFLYENLEQKVEERTLELQTEKKKSDALLLNILPETVAEELKRRGRTTPHRFDKVTVLFTDFVDFTRITERMNPDDLVEEIGGYFAEFDRIMDVYGLEKIKTIGDSYMCAGGLPEPDDDHVLRVVKAAIDIRSFMLGAKAEKEARGQRPFAIRIGIHTGPVIAGVVGLKKFAYDIWGDTVNTASRMESYCEPWEINLSRDTLDYVKDQIAYTHRGKIDAKSKGEIDMYYISFDHQEEA